MLALLAAGVFVGYGYCSHEENGTLSDCATNTAIDLYRTLWGNPKGYETRTFYSEALGQTMEYVVYLPPGYSDLRNRSMRYPVVYLLPGTSGSTRVWMNAGDMANQMDNLLDQGQVQPMILVTAQQNFAQLTPAGGYADGPRGDWETYTTRDLVNEIDSKYRTIRSKDGRAIAGNSEGGYGAMNLGLRNPSEFGVIGSFSGYFTIDDKDLSQVFDGDESLAEANNPMAYVPQLEGSLPLIYIVVGQDEGKNLQENLKFAEELKAQGASFEFHTFAGKHNWDSWREELPGFLVFASENLSGGE
jgi:enterochelin esterase-like enzyme